MSLPSLRRGSFRVGETLLVDGPVFLRVVRGAASVFGARVGEGESLVVRRGRRVPLTPLSSDVGYEARGSGDIAVAEGGAIPSSWVKTVGDALREGWSRVVVVGDVDSGKSSLCTYIVNMAVGRGLRVGFVDGDVGQPDTGPPTTVTGAMLREQSHSLGVIKGATMRFVGLLSPSLCGEDVNTAVQSVAEELEGQGASPTLVNTDGWIRDGGLGHKASLVRRLRPDAVLSLLAEDENEELVSLAEARVLSVERPEHARTRSHEERRENRERKYREYFRDATRTRSSLEGRELVLSPLLRRLAASEPRASPATLPPGLDLGALEARYPGWERGLLAGLEDGVRTLSLAIVLRLDRARGFVDLFSNPAPGWRRVAFGAVRLDDQFRELPL